MDTTSLSYLEDIISYQMSSCCASYRISTPLLWYSQGFRYRGCKCNNWGQLPQSVVLCILTGCGLLERAPCFLRCGSYWSGTQWLREAACPVSPKDPPVSVSLVLGTQACATWSSSGSHAYFSNTYSLRPSPHPQWLHLLVLAITMYDIFPFIIYIYGGIFITFHLYYTFEVSDEMENAQLMFNNQHFHRVVNGILPNWLLYGLIHAWLHIGWHGNEHILLSSWSSSFYKNS